MKRKQNTDSQIDIEVNTEFSQSWCG